VPVQRRPCCGNVLGAKIRPQIDDVFQSKPADLLRLNSQIKRFLRRQLRGKRCDLGFYGSQLFDQRLQTASLPNRGCQPVRLQPEFLQPFLGCGFPGLVVLPLNLSIPTSTAVTMAGATVLHIYRSRTAKEIFTSSSRGTKWNRRAKRSVSQSEHGCWPWTAPMQSDRT
jgi:hypothetical protein